MLKENSLVVMDTTSIVLETNRLKLVPITLKYLDDIFKEFTAEIATYLVPQPTGNPKDIEKFITLSLESMRQGETLKFVALHQQTKEFLGCVGLHKIHTSQPEMRIWLKKSAQGHNYGKEALFALKDWAEENLSYDYITYSVVRTNIASRKIAEYLGGKVMREFISYNQNEQEMDQVEYWISKVA